MAACQRMVAELIDHIEVHHAEKQDAITNQRVDIHYNCIGAFDVPDRRKIPEADIIMETRKGVALSYAPERLAVWTFRKIKKQSVHYRILRSYKDTLHGRSDRIRTCGILLPNQARYQLRYTRIFNFCHDTTANGKNKVFSVCGHSCGQSRFCAAFSNQGKSRKRRRHKALRRFVLPCPG